MDERHENEQYFFAQPTIDAVADVLERLERPCVVCAPLIGRALEARGIEVATLDIDRRFSSLRGFRYWNLHHPERIEQRFGVIFCDPPFFNVSLNQLFRALRMLAHFDFAQPMAIGYLQRRSGAVLSAFDAFNLKPTGFMLDYSTVKKCEKNRIELFANFALPGTPS